MDVLDRLLKDHKTFREIIRQIDTILAGPLDGHQPRLIALIDLFKEHLVLHCRIEDTLLYPAVYEASRKKNVRSPLHERHELDETHQKIHTLLNQLESEVRARPLSPSWPKTYTFFCCALEPHLQVEEKNIFAWAKTFLASEELQRLLETSENRLNKKRPPPRPQFEADHEPSLAH